jgi:hypothetical protein
MPRPTVRMILQPPSVVPTVSATAHTSFTLLQIRPCRLQLAEHARSLTTRLQ